MNSLHDQLFNLFLELSPFLRNVFIFISSFGEGLPVLGSFLPGGTIALLIGALSEEGFINPWSAVHIIALGSMLGDLVGFFVGKKLLHFKWVKNIIYSEKQSKNWDIFDRHAALVIILGKLIPIIRSTPALFAGARKMNIYRYIIYILIASYIWSIAGVFGGKYLAHIVGDALLPIIVGIILISILITLFQRKKK